MSDTRAGDPGTAAGHTTQRAALPVRIVPMTEAHLGEVLRIDAAGGLVAWPRSLYEQELSQPNRLYLVALVGRQVVGSAGMMIDADGAHVTTLSVDPACQHAKVGTRLMLALALHARRQASTLELEVGVDNVAAQALYRRFGLAPVGVRVGYYDVGDAARQGQNLDALVMRASDIDQPEYARRLVGIGEDLGLSVNAVGSESRPA